MGLLGGFTTFSTFGLDTLLLARVDATGALLNVGDARDRWLGRGLGRLPAWRCRPMMARGLLPLHRRLARWRLRSCGCRHLSNQHSASSIR
jgi:hypothetical protein